MRQHRARLANLADDLPELGEALAEYVARIVREFGTTYRDAAREVRQAAARFDSAVLPPRGRRAVARSTPHPHHPIRHVERPVVGPPARFLAREFRLLFRVKKREYLR